MGIFTDINLILDILIIIIPVIIGIYLVIKFVVPKHPKLGIGLAIGGGLLAAFLVKRRLKNAFDVENKIAEHNEMIAKFKNKQKQRHEAVMANKKVIETLEKQRKKLAKNAGKYETEIKLIDAELEERRALNKKILENSEEFLESLETGSKQRKELLRRYEGEQGTIEINEPVEEITSSGSASTPVIEINGFRLLEG